VNNSKRIIRVFPSKTAATPDDALVRINQEPGLLDEADEVHVSVTFTWDLKRAEQLEKAWKVVAPVKLGGPAAGTRGEEFTPGMYLKKGYVITSRGCNNKCWFCQVPRRDGFIREIPITEGSHLQDDNILACSREHIEKVFSMLKRHKPCHLTGGIEPSLVDDWAADQLRALTPKQLYLAYDDPDTGDLDALVEAAGRLRFRGFTHNQLRCYVLVGYPKDTLTAAEMRLKQVCSLGLMPFAMAYRNKLGEKGREWVKFQRRWAQPAIIQLEMKKYGYGGTNGQKGKKGEN